MPVIQKFLSFKQYQQPLKKPQYTIAFINVMLIGLGLYFLSSQFLVAPGMSISLPKSLKGENKGVSVSSVLTIVHDNMLFFEGHIYTLKKIKKTWSHLPTKNRGVLLIKCHKNTEIQTFFTICQMAKKIGFEAIHIASIEESNAEEAWINTI